MITTLRAGLYVIAIAACLLGLCGILSNLVLPFMPGPKWNFFGPFEVWDPSAPPGTVPDPEPIPWWAVSLLDVLPWLAGPVGYGFYALCLTWGLGTVIMLRSILRSIAGRALWSVSLFCAWWLSGLGGIVALVWFFVSAAQEAARAGPSP